MNFAAFLKASTNVVSFCSAKENLKHPLMWLFRCTLPHIPDPGLDCLLVEAPNEFGEELLRLLLDLRKVDAGPPFFPTCDELADEFIGQILEIGDSSRGRTVKL